VEEASAVKRSSITRRKTPRQSEYDEEFEAMKPIIRARSGGKCEAARIAVEYVMHHASPESTKALADFIEWHDVNCDGRATNVHHRKYRGKSRGGTNGKSNLADLSLACHAYAHRHGGFAQPANLLGLTLSAGQSEEL
jgi:hypothetical protein